MKKLTYIVIILFFSITIAEAQSWCGTSNIFINNISYGGSNATISTAGKFNGANLGILSSRFYLAGQLEVYPSTTTSAVMYYRIDKNYFRPILLPKSGTDGNNSVHYGISIIPIDTFTVGTTHTIDVYFKAGSVYDNNSGNYYKATFTVGKSSVPTSTGQLLTPSLEFPTEDQPLDIIFDLTQGNQALASFSADSMLYVHTGVITDKSTSSSDWKYTSTWLDNQAKYMLMSLGNSQWKFTIPSSLRSFYEVPDGETIKDLAFVVRNSTGSIIGRDTGDKDIFLQVYDNSLHVKIKSIDSPNIVSKDSILQLNIVSSAKSQLKLYLNGNLLKSISDTTKLSATYTCSTPGSFWFVAEATSGSYTVRDSAFVLIKKDVTTATKPTNVGAGINIIDGTTATLVLYAPGKSSVYAIGDFNNWTLSNNYMLNKDGDYWWITLTGLTSGQEYGFQYLVDDNLRIADPYADKLLDPDYDSAISSTIYPDLKTYPTGKTSGIVSVLQTGQTAYEWKNTNYTLAPKDKLVIYELLVRDFTTAHSFDAAKEKLDYLQSLGVNAIELMPINEFEGNSSWGYNPSFYFAVDKYYGTKNAYKAFIDECHNRGIAVIMDLVLNHSYEQSPFVQLYWDSTNNRPAADNPWYNVTSPNTTYSWGYDFNHESLQTQALVDSINSYWMKEYKVDGFRFDFTKGFTNTSGDGYAYDASRITLLKRMANQIWKRNPNAYVIFEHLTDNSEETVLANVGIMLWGNMNYNYCEAIMGWTSNTDLSWGIYSNRGWSSPNLISYMESHDEERMMYKALTYGNASGTYSAKELTTALDRAKLCASFYLLEPGPKMIWQFGELGYDYSINTASDGVTIGDSYRTDEKPVRWDYYNVTERKALYDVYSKLIALKEAYPVFSGSDISYSVGATDVKSIIWRSTDLNAFLVGNFGVTSNTVSITLPKSGSWYNVFSGQYETISSTTFSATLSPGEFRLYTDQSVSSITSQSSKKETPVTISNERLINNTENDLLVEIYDMTGRTVLRTTLSDWVDISFLAKNTYLLRTNNNGNFYSTKFMK